jgi:hypothetical protein
MVDGIAEIRLCAGRRRFLHGQKQETTCLIVKALLAAVGNRPRLPKTTRHLVSNVMCARPRGGGARPVQGLEEEERGGRESNRKGAGAQGTRRGRPRSAAHLNFDKEREEGIHEVT